MKGTPKHGAQTQIAPARLKSTFLIMTQDPSAKHMVWAIPPDAKAEIGFGFSSLLEAEMEAEKMKRAGYKIVRIKPINLPKPNC